MLAGLTVNDDACSSFSSWWCAGSVNRSRWCIDSFWRSMWCGESAIWFPLWWLVPLTKPFLWWLLPAAWLPWCCDLNICSCWYTCAWACDFPLCSRRSGMISSLWWRSDFSIWFGFVGDGLPLLLEWTCASSRSIGTFSVCAAARAPDDIVDAFDCTCVCRMKKKKEKE